MSRLLNASDIAAASRTPIALGVIGQSNEVGAVLASDLGAYPQAFASLRNPNGVRVPIGPAQQVSGGFWPKVYDDLYDWGYDLQIVNGAIGSMSFVKHGAGQITYRNSNQVYYRKRTNAGWPDRGYSGDMINVSNRMFRCTTGADIAAMNNAPFRTPAGGLATVLDYLSFGTGGVSAASAPDFSGAANVGDTVVDGAVTWTLESLTAYGASGLICNEAQAGVGFDPLGILQRTHDEMQRIRGVQRKIIYMQNAQSDLLNNQTWYRDALVSQANFFLARGYEVMIGLSCYQATSDQNANYQKLQAARTDALTILRSGTYAARVLDGADLYALMGSTGNMATNGSYFQTTGGGANVHLNGAGALAAAGYIANALKAVMTQRTV